MNNKFYMEYKYNSKIGVKVLGTTEEHKKINKLSSYLYKEANDLFYDDKLTKEEYLEKYIKDLEIILSIWGYEYEEVSYE